MRKLLLSSVAALGLAGTASAADLPVAPVAYVPAFTWTGCYLGANGGWIGGNDDYNAYIEVGGIGPNGPTGVGASNASRNSFSSDESAGTFGGQFGCQFQAGSWVIGGEWDWNWSGLKENNTYYDPNTTGQYFSGYPWYQHTHKQVDWFSTARARLGLAWDRVLVYATGGLAYAGYNAYTNIDFVPGQVTGPEFFGAYDENRFGWTVGGGLEWAFSNNWTAKAEFLYLDFGSFDYASHRINSPNCLPAGVCTATWNTSIDAKEYVARIGINYLFHTGGAPVVARY